MSGRFTLLGVVLIVQVALAALLLWSRAPSSEEGAGFLDVAADQVEAVTVRDGDGNEVRIDRDADGWRLESGLPADADKVNELLEKLVSLQAVWPVATSQNSAERFEVLEDGFQKRIIMSAGEDVLADILLGTSPGYRRVHARLVGQDDVFSIDFSNYQAPVEVDDWLDKTLLGTSADITEVARQDRWRVTRSDEGWLLNDAAANSEAVDTLVSRVRTLRVMGVRPDPDGGSGTEDEADAEPDAESDADTDFNADAATDLLNVVDTEGDYRLAFYLNEEEDEYLVRSSRVAGAFTLSSYVAEQILVDAEALEPESEVAQTNGSEGAPEDSTDGAGAQGVDG